MLLTIIAFILILGFLVLVHELGHFLVARRLRVGVEEFGLGFPPTLWRRAVGATRFCLNLIPLGGYVKIKGEDGESASEPDSFASRPVWQRTVIVAAGVIMNVVAGWLILILLFATGVPATIDPDTNRAYVRESEIIIERVLPDTNAERAGLQAGDKIAAINGAKLGDTPSFRAYLEAHKNEALAINYVRNGQNLTATVATQDRPVIDGQELVLGVAFSEVGIVRYPVAEAALVGTKSTFSYLSRIGSALYHIVKRVAGGGGIGETLGGPVAIAVATSDVVELGWPYALLFTAILSFNLALINILPFPALDGGRIVFFIVEKLRGRPSRALVEAWFHRVGFALLILLAVVVTYNDIMRFGGRIWQAIIK